MQMVSTQFSYSSTGYFSRMLLDYLNGQQELKPFYEHPVSIEGIKAAIDNRKQFNTNRTLLVNVLQQQYKGISLTAKQQLNLQLLNDDNTYTICTAHQPNIFTGHLYFIYKILHTVKLAASLTEQLTENNFVPVYYMGSEDADLEELGHIYLDGIKYEWKTDQQGAVGRMKVDKALVQLIDQLSGQLLVHEFGKDMVELLKQSYQPGVSIEQATFKLVNTLFAEYGLLVLLPDNRLLKQSFASVMKRELLEQFSHKAVAETVAAFPSTYKVQAGGRALNLFYLQDNSRERIEAANGGWSIVNSEKIFNREEILNELKSNPERFSPNVILRPVYQEMILPNVAFIGGGGEIAYWLELKQVFEAAGVPYPMLVLRNSFLLVNEKNALLIKKLNFKNEDIFKPEFELMNRLVKKESSIQLSLEKEKVLLADLYRQLRTIAGKADVTLQVHTAALHKKALDKIEILEKKILKAEKKKFEAEQRQLHKLKQELFPHNNLQERVENFMLYYAKFGNGFVNNLYNNSLSLEQVFTVLTEK
ncbi:MAG: bacillithiol biosynthesis cysteine-adding enzyme BshC [Chitinophagaceae bacterium]|nr:bacillithiol biosynthesis cysteine-adding enzyme BshC [Chitinophagaceae bacterium]